MLKPLLVGKLQKTRRGGHILVGSQDSVRAVEAEDVRVLQAFTGHATAAAIAKELALPEAEVARVATNYAGSRFVMDVSEWNKLSWDPQSRTYLNAAKGGSAWFRLPAALRDRLNQVALSPPCDPWICLEVERKWICESISRLTGLDLDNNRFLLANNCLVEGRFFWEIVLNGIVVAKVEFRGADEEDWTWEFSADLAAVVADDEGSSWEEQLDRLIVANLDTHRQLVLDTTAFIEQMCDQQPSAKPLLYFSGGKESVVTLNLFRLAQQPAQLLFAATGWDFPEDTSFINELQGWIASSDELNALFQLHIEQADEDASVKVLRAEAKLGPRDMWCRSKVKYPVRSRAVKKLYPGGVPLAFEGSRWYETDYRRGNPRINEITDIDGYEGKRQRWAHALADWNGVDIWMHMFHYRLPINPLYRQGFQRTTCWMCPLIVPFHTAQSKRQNPALWARVEHVRFEGLDTLATKSNARTIPV